MEITRICILKKYTLFLLQVKDMPGNEFLATLTSLAIDLSPMLDDDDCKREVVY